MCCCVSSPCWLGALTQGGVAAVKSTVEPNAAKQALRDRHTLLPVGGFSSPRSSRWVCSPSSWPSRRCGRLGPGCCLRTIRSRLRLCAVVGGRPHSGLTRDTQAECLADLGHLRESIGCLEEAIAHVEVVSIHHRATKRYTRSRFARMLGDVVAADRDLEESAGAGPQGRLQRRLANPPRQLH
jgi:hypothetical protein